MLENQLTKIRALQTHQLDSGPAAELVNQLAFAVELAKPVHLNELTEQLASWFPEIEFKIEAIFEDDAHPVHFLLNIPSVSFQDLPGSEFEVMYAIQDRSLESEKLKILNIEPALELGFTDLQLDETSENDAGIAKPLGCFTPKHKKPTPGNQMGLEFDWALKKMSIPEARTKYRVSGKNVCVAQIDTGIAAHDEINQLNPLDGINLFGDSTGAKDPLTDPDGFLNPGHGTATSSVLLSGPAGRIDGVAPDIDYFPIRAIRTVIRLSQWRVAKGIDKARKGGAQIITMSLGGIWSWILREAVKRAEKQNILVLAAAGNCVPFVVYPARFRGCLAVAGTSPEMPKNGWHSESPWVGSSRGKSVDVSAPGQFVWCASRKPDELDTNLVGAGEGTSFSVALTAGVAALWLERHGQNNLISQLARGESLMDMFRSAIKDSARTTPPLGDKMGSGIVDALNLLDFDLDTRSKQERVHPDQSDDLVEHTLEMLTELGAAANLKLLSEELKDDVTPIALELQTLILKSALRKSNILSDPISVSEKAGEFFDTHPLIANAMGL